MRVSFKLSKAIDHNGNVVEMMTINQFCNKYGYKTQQIYQKARMLTKENEPGLDIVYPYPDTDKEEDSETGPTFILMNKKTVDYMSNRKKKKVKKPKISDSPKRNITIVLHKDWEKSMLIKDVANERGGEGVLFCLRMMQEIALAPNNSLNYTTKLFNKFLDEYGYVKEQLTDLLNVTINEIKLFEKHKVDETEEGAPIVHLKCPLYEDLFKI